MSGQLSFLLFCSVYAYMMPAATTTTTTKEEEEEEEAHKIKKWKENRPEKLCCLFLELLLRHRQSSAACAFSPFPLNQNRNKTVLFSLPLSTPSSICETLSSWNKYIFATLARVIRGMCVLLLPRFWTHNPKVHLLYWPIKHKQTALSLCLKIVCAQTMPSRTVGWGARRERCIF